MEKVIILALLLVIQFFMNILLENSDFITKGNYLGLDFQSIHKPPSGKICFDYICILSRKLKIKPI